MIEKKKTQNLEDILINRPEKLRALQQTSEWSITLFGWVVWFAFCRPVIVALLWYLGFKFFYVYMIRLEGIYSLIKFFSAYIFVIFFILIGTRIWNFYNQKRFRGRNRRINVQTVSTEELGHYFKLRPGLAAKIQESPEVTVIFLENGKFRIQGLGSDDDSEGCYLDVAA